MTDKTSRGRQRIYTSSSEKVSAFRERNKEMGLLRKEVLVSADTATRLTELARQQDTSVTNVASGLLEMGLAHYETLHDLGYVANSVVQGNRVVASAFSTAAQGMDTLSAITGALARSRTLTNTEPASPPDASSCPADEAVPFQVPDPINNFFQKRKALK